MTLRLYSHLPCPLLPQAPTPHGKLATQNILSPTCSDGSFCCEILTVADICDPRVQSQRHGNSHLVGAVSFGEYVFKMLLHLKGNIFRCKRKLQVILSYRECTVISHQETN